MLGRGSSTAPLLTFRAGLARRQDYGLNTTKCLKAIISFKSLKQRKFLRDEKRILRERESRKNQLLSFSIIKKFEWYLFNLLRLPFKITSPDLIKKGPLTTTRAICILVGSFFIVCLNDPPFLVFCPII